MANPSIDKTRVRNLPANGVFTVNNIAPDGLGNVTITAGDVGAIGNVNDTNSIDLTKFGTDISADLVVDVNTDNLISVSPTGTFADKRAIAHSYDNATSGLTATTVQGAIDEVEARVDTAETSITTLQTDVGTLQGDVTALQTGKLETVSDTNSIDLTKTGVNVSAALKLDVSANNLISVSGAGTFADERASAHTYSNTISGINATNVQNALDEILSLNRSNNVTITRDINNQVIQIVDVANSQTWNIDWTDFNNLPAKLYIQRLGDPKIYTITYSTNGYPDSIIYA